MSYIKLSRNDTGQIHLSLDLTDKYVEPDDKFFSIDLVNKKVKRVKADWDDIKNHSSKDAVTFFFNKTLDGNVRIHENMRYKSMYITIPLNCKYDGYINDIHLYGRADLFNILVEFFRSFKHIDFKKFK